LPYFTSPPYNPLNVNEIEIVPLRADSIISVQADYVLLKNVVGGVFGPEAGVNHAMGGLLALHNTPGKTSPGYVEIVRSDEAIAAPSIILVGVGSGSGIQYGMIRLMIQKAVEELAQIQAAPSTLATMSHGVGFGLDHEEVLYAQLFGLKEVLEANPSVKITTVLYNEIDNHAYRRIITYLEKLSLKPDSTVRKCGSRYFMTLGRESAVAASSAHRIQQAATVFLAMPFREEFENVYDFGLRAPLTEAGFLPIRLDRESFLGSITEEIKGRIRDASAVIADISEQNPNVLYELGFAQGYGIPTIVICRNGQELPFDVRDTKILFYNPLLLRELNAGIREVLEQVLLPGAKHATTDERRQ
jgi:hypothetical protein